jgi:hypothetical protein
MLPQHQPSDNNSRLLAQFMRAVLAHDYPTVNRLIPLLDRLSANECHRQLGEEWGFPTLEVQGQCIMATRDLAMLVYGTPSISNIRRMLRRFGRKPLYLQDYNSRYHASIRTALGFAATASDVALAVWADLLIIGMRGHTEGAKKLQAYLLKAERDNRIRWTMEQLQAGVREMAQRAAAHLERTVQVNWSKLRNELLFREGLPVYLSWTQSHYAHTEMTSEQLAALIPELGLRDIHKPGERLSILQVIRAIKPEAGASISAESEYMVRGLQQLVAERLSIQYIQPLARELRQYGIRMQEETDFNREIDEGESDALQ